MNAMTKRWLGVGLLSVGLLGAALAQGMMGGGMPGMMGGSSMMVTYSASARPISQSEARRRAEGYVLRYGPGVTIKDFMVFTENFYVQVVDSRTGQGLAELLVDRYTGVVQPEHGPNMMWNTRSATNPGMGMMGGVQNQRGMMGQAAPTTVRFDQTAAQKLADTFLAGYLPGAKVLEGLAFPGHYTFDYGRKDIEGMLSVNALSGEVWLHTWHGFFLGEAK